MKTSTPLLLGYGFCLEVDRIFCISGIAFAPVLERMLSVERVSRLCSNGSAYGFGHTLRQCLTLSQCHVLAGALSKFKVLRHFRSLDHTLMERSLFCTLVHLYSWYNG